MTASIGVDLLKAGFAWSAIVLVLLAVWGVFVLVAHIGHRVERLVEKWSRGYRERHAPKTYEEAYAQAFEGQVKELGKALNEFGSVIGRELGPVFRKLSKPFDQERD